MEGYKIECWGSRHNMRVQNNARIRNRMCGYNIMGGYKIECEDTRCNARI